MNYELWDARSRNMIAHWKNASDAELDLSSLAREHGLRALSEFFVVHEDENEDSHLVAEGEAILVAIKRLSAEEKTMASARRVG